MTHTRYSTTGWRRDARANACLIVLVTGGNLAPYQHSRSGKLAQTPGRSAPLHPASWLAAGAPFPVSPACLARSRRRHGSDLLFWQGFPLLAWASLPNKVRSQCCFKAYPFPREARESRPRIGSGSGASSKAIYLAVCVWNKP